MGINTNFEGMYSSKFKHILIKYPFKMVTALFLCLQILAVHAQTAETTIKSTNIQTIDGVKYYLHVVGKGETVYAISKTYDCPVSDILMENTKAIDGIQSGMILKIPVVRKTPKQETKENNTPSSKETSTYKVGKGETMYSIAKSNNTTVEKLIELNPELKTGGLKADQNIKVPSTSGNETIIKNAPTVSSINTTTPPPVISINNKTVTITGNNSTTKPALPNTSIAPSVVQNTPATPGKPILTPTAGAKYGYPGTIKKEYNIALFLPFHSLEASGLGIDKLIRGEDQFSAKTNIALQFYEGALIAIDSLKKQHLNAKIFVYDVDDNDSLAIPHLLRKPELAEMDLMIGPLYASSFMPVSKFAKAHSIPIVSPFVQANKILFDNPFVCKATSSNALQVVQMANFVVDSFHTQNIILINNGNKKDIELCDVFKKIAKDVCANKMYPLDSVKEVKGYGNIKQYLKSNKVNVLVLPSNNQSYVTEFINTINTLQNDYKIIVFGLQSWMNYDNLDFEYLNSLSLHLVSNIHINYNDEQTKKFVSKFTTNYKTNPDIYAFSGFDITYYFVDMLQKHGEGFLNDLVEHTYKGLMLNLQFIKSTTNNSGYENRYVRMLKYENYELKPAN
jgi:LysM repeat protein